MYTRRLARDLSNWVGYETHGPSWQLNAEPKLFQFKAKITYLIKSNAQKYHILRNQHKNLRKIMTYG